MHLTTSENGTKSTIDSFEQLVQDDFQSQFLSLPLAHNEFIGGKVNSNNDAIIRENEFLDSLFYEIKRLHRFGIGTQVRSKKPQA